MIRFVVLAAGLALASVAGSALAHTQSTGFVDATIADGRVEGRIAIAVRDLDVVLGLDTDGDGSITWGEVRARETSIADAMLGGLSIGAADAPCRLEAAPLAVETRSEEAYLSAPFSGPCPQDGPVEVGYDHLFDVDAGHRGLVALRIAGVAHALVMTPDSRHATIGAGGESGLDLFLDFVREGVHHIWIGFDHILFLLTLMLGALVVRRDGAATPSVTVRETAMAIATVVTAFTAAHSVTLALAVLDVVRPPAALIEAAIAGSIVIAAVNTIWPVLSGRTWMIAFGFGLIHGFGFANVLAELDLPDGGLVAALLAFNVGVELGQLAIVVVALPLLLILTRSTSCPRFAVPAMSILIACIGAAWFVGRVLDVDVLPIG